MLQFRKYTLLLFFLCTGLCQAQTKRTEQLSAQLKKAVTPHQRLNGLLALFEEYQSLNRDTLYHLALEARGLAAEQNDADKKGLSAMALADAYMMWGWKDSALSTLSPLLSSEKDYSTDTWMKMQRHYAMIYGNTLQYEKALSILYPALTVAEKRRDTVNAAAIMNSIGSIAMAMGKLSESSLWIQKAIQLSAVHPGARVVLAAAYTNAANGQLLSGNRDSSEYYIRLAIPLARETENLHILATALRINTSLLTERKKIAEAEASLKEMLSIRKITSGEDLFVEDNLKLAEFYSETGQPDKAIDLCFRLLNGTREQNGISSTVLNPKVRLEYWMALAGYYKKANRQNDYREALEKVIVLKDSLYEANSAQAIADAEIKYQVQKNQNTILQQKYSLQRNRTLLYGSLGLLALLLVIVFFTVRDLRRRQRLKMELAMAGEKIKAETAVKNAEEKERLRIAADLHDNIGAYASAIRADVEKIAQGAGTMNNLDNLQQHSQEIMNSLRDTIWALNKENITITGISDRIKNYISKLQPSYSQVQFNIEENAANDRRINSQAALNLFRIVQEAVHNALKHSRAKNIDVVIFSENHAFIRVADDGIGLNGHAQQGSGNGIKNMQARAAESGLQLFFHTAEQSGTVVEIQIPTTN